VNPRRILFVDDDVNILDGLRNLLRSQRRVWEMTFVESGADALAELGKAPFDVIVTDMRMPGMDGGTLLRHVKDAHPTIARIVLSGHAEQDCVMRSLAVAHQFLSKPCDGDVLQAVIERTCNLQALLQDEATRKAVGQVDKLPSTARTYWALTDAVRKPDVGTAVLAGIVEEDPAMPAKVLQLVNSAYFGLSHRVTSIQQAVLFLGVELLKGLVLTAQVFGILEKTPIPGFSLDHLQEHSLLTARVARRLVSDRDTAEDAFTAAVIHDVGQIVLAQGLPGPFTRVAETIRASGRPRQDVEREVLGVSHAEVGAYLLGVWGLPFSIIEAVAYHHTPGHVTVGARDLLAAVHTADAVVDEATDGRRNDAVPRGLDVDFLQTIGWTVDVPRWRDLAADTCASARTPAAMSRAATAHP
jgi:HD-like signal output (HDOD) protein